MLLYVMHAAWKHAFLLSAFLVSIFLYFVLKAMRGFNGMQNMMHSALLALVQLANARHATYIHIVIHRPIRLKLKADTDGAKLDRALSRRTSW